MNEFIKNNIVIVAHNLNPSIFTQIWLVKNNIINENDFLSDSLFTSAVVSVNTNDLQLLVVPERIQLTFKNKETQEKLINEVLRKIVNLLPHTPYSAIGFNFELILEPVDLKEFPKITKSIFVSDRNPLVTFFDNEDSRFGIVMTREVEKMRLNLNIRPVEKITESGKEEALKFIFNFNKNLEPESALETINAILNSWTIAKEMCDKIIKKMGAEWKI